MHLWYMAVLISDMLFSHSFYFTELYKRTWFVGVAGSAVVTPALLVRCFPMAANRSGETASNCPWHCKTITLLQSW